MDLMILLSECVFCLVWELLCRRVVMHLAVSFLYTSLSVGGGGGVLYFAFWVFGAGFVTMFFFLGGN